MKPSHLPRWLAISIAVHLALVLSIGTVWRSSTSVAPSSAAVLIVSLADAPHHEPSAAPLPLRSSKPIPASSDRTQSQADPKTDSPAPDRVADAVAERAPLWSADTPVSPSAPASEVVDPAPGADPADRSSDAVANGSASFLIESPPNEDDTALDRYRALVLSILERTKRYPLLAQHRGLQGTVEIAFTIDGLGRVSNPELVESSHHAVLDEAAVAMAYRLGSLPPPPEAPLRFPARIEYRIESLASPISTEGVHP